MNDKLIEYQEKMSKLIRIRQLSIAILKRAKNAEIPPTEMRINKAQFKELLDNQYFQSKSVNMEKLCEDMYTVPSTILNKAFILIDGGNMYNRKRAGFAILFRAIAWDRMGMHVGCAKAAHLLHSIKAIGDVTRNEYSDELKSYDILFLSECSKELFKPSFETGSFFDEILENREVTGKTTIISFINPIPARGSESKERCSDISTGQYMMLFSESDSNENIKNILRIRVK